MAKKTTTSLNASEASKILAMIPEYFKGGNNSTEGLKTTSTAKAEPVSKPKITPVVKKGTITAITRHPYQMHIFPCILPKKYLNTHSVYQLNFGEKFFITKGKVFYESVSTNMTLIDRKMRLGYTTTDIFAKLIPHLVKNKILTCEAVILFQPEDPMDMIKYEQDLLDKYKNNKACLNNIFESYVPKWIKDQAPAPEPKIQTLPDPSADILLHNEQHLFIKTPADAKKPKLSKAYKTVDVKRNRKVYSPEYVQEMNVAIQKNFSIAYDFVFPEYPYRRVISDYLLLKNNIVTEIEVKCSITDYWNDFNKLASGGTFLTKKHTMLKKGTFISNYFYFLCPEGVVLPEEIPDHCGLIIAWKGPDEEFNFKVVKEAPKLHENYVAESFYKSTTKYLMDKVQSLKNTITLLKTTVNAKEKAKSNKNKPTDPRKVNPER